MSDIGLMLVIVVAWVTGAHLGYWVGRVREQNRLIPEILEERDRADRLAMLLKLQGGNHD